MYIYEHHMSGNLYTSEIDLDLDDLQCPICGDYDWVIGEASNKEEFLELIKSKNFDQEYLEEFIKENFKEAQNDKI